MRGRGTTWIAACLACLLTGCADREVPGAPAAQPVAPRDEPAPAPAPASPAQPATTAGKPASAAEDTRVRPAPPVPPTGVVAKALSSSQIALSWQGAPDSAVPAGYEIFRDGRLVSKASEPRFTDDHLRPWSSHCYAVQSYDAYGQRSPRSPQACARTPDDKPPTEPGDLKAEARPVNSVTLTWRPSTDDDEVDGYEVSRGGKPVATVKTSGLVEPGLAPAKEYCYSVTAVDRARNRSAAGSACIVVPDSTPPTIPTNAAASADGEHAITVSWSASTDDVGVARYELSADGEAPKPLGPPAQTTAREGGLAVGSRHCYGVRACDASDNCSAWTSAVCATTPDLTPPSPPSPSAVAGSDTEIEVRWGASTDNVGVTGYEVLRIAEVVARTETGTSWRDAGLRPGRKYCYAVRAHDLAGNTSSLSAKACASTPDLKAPTSPGRPAAVPVSSTQTFLGWDASTDDVGVTGYEVYRDTSLVATVTATRAREYRLQPAQKYCYTVRALDAAGNRSPAAGPFCTVTTTPAELSAPSDLRVRRLSRTNILLQWEPSEAKDVLYRIYAQGDRLAGLTADNAFTPSGTFGAEPNCFRVAALDTNNRESSRSNEVCATSADGTPPAAR